jgi:hydrogenase maturation protease
MTMPAAPDEARRGQLLIAGVGNIFLGDDGFGVDVAKRLASADLPEWVHVADYGIRGMHLAYDLADRYDSAILVDAMSRGSEPGTVYVVEPDLADVPEPSADTGSAADVAAMMAGSPMLDAHGMQPDVVLRMLATLGAGDRQVLIVGCEPAQVSYGMGLSAPVAAAIDDAVRVILDLVSGAAASDQHALVTKEQTHVPGHPR